MSYLVLTIMFNLKFPQQCFALYTWMNLFLKFIRRILELFCYTWNVKKNYKLIRR